jgi:UDPglucose 6-dehydrogenase
MRISVFGAGYVGLVTAACLAELGNKVICCDVDSSKIDKLLQGVMPIYEPGLDELVLRNQQDGRLSFVTDPSIATVASEILIIAVGTPMREDGQADLTYVMSVADAIGAAMTGFKVVVDKSTVPVGTAEQVEIQIRKQLASRLDVQASFTVVSNPEFLKEGVAIQDFMRPDRIIVGVDSDELGAQGRAMMQKLYAPFNRNHERTLYMSVRAAEFTKYAANAMLATRISFMNELANLADQVGVDIEMVRKGIGSDPRIGFDFLYAGTGYGGSCFPKDVQALIQSGQQQGQDMHILKSVHAVNEHQKTILARKIFCRLGENLSGQTLAVWGLSFKPGTDDVREAPSRSLIAQLLRHGAKIQAFDPVASDEFQRALELDLADEPHLLAGIQYVNKAMDAIEKAHALVIVTEWKAFKSPDWELVKDQLLSPIIFDGRNLFEPTALHAQGLEYHGIGRTHIH